MSQVPEQQYQTWGNTGGGAASNLFRTFSCCGIPAPPPAPQLCLHPPPTSKVLLLHGEVGLQGAIVPKCCDSLLFAIR